MKRLHAWATVATMLVTSSAAIGATPAKPTRPGPPAKPATPPAPPQDTGPTTGDIIRCMATGNSIQICMIGGAGN